MNILIIGAGASGLTAARILSKEENNVIVLEARDRIGGRIHTTVGNMFSAPLENGAEFMHGNLPRTKDLAKEAGVNLIADKGVSYSIQKGEPADGDFLSDHWEALMKKLNELDQDISIAAFLDQHFSDSMYDELRASVRSFVQGFDAADVNKASAFALREEWSENDTMEGYHIEGGYVRLISFLQQECLNQGVVFHLSTVARQILWNKGGVTVMAENGEKFLADRILITAPPAVIRNGDITFSPELQAHDKALQKIETGGVIKFMIEFNEAIWENPALRVRQFHDMGFLFSDAPVPTWWTQPSGGALLTGWLSGPATFTLNKSDAELLHDAIQSLAYLFQTTADELKLKIRAARVVNWNNDPFSLGAYAYKTVDTAEALDVLNHSVEGVIYFAGEAYYRGPEMGTVEAALASGEAKARQLLSKIAVV